MRDDEGKLEELVARYLAEKKSAGGLDIEVFVQRFPACASELRDVLQGMELMERAAEALVAEEPLSELQTRAVLGEACQPRTSPRSTPDDKESTSEAFVARALEDLEARGVSSVRYFAEGELARGGQGAVLVVWDATLRRRLAMKVALASRSEKDAQRQHDARSLGRFLEEAHVTAQLDHPGIVPVHDLGLDRLGRVFFTMKLVKGRDLKTIFELVHAGREGWTETRALGVLLRICEAMAYAHSKGVIHRDLKPSNVMVGRFGEVYVMDWGLARVAGREGGSHLGSEPTCETSALRREDLEGPDAPPVTADGDVVGTPAYMPPEQARGDLSSVGPHSDVYSLGAMLYHLLAGQAPHAPLDARCGHRASLTYVQQGPPQPLNELAPDAPDELVAICEKAMAREPAARYRHMDELAEDLRAFLEHRVVSAYETGAVAELRKWVERNRKLAAAIAAAIALLIAGFTTSLAFKANSDRNAERAKEGEALANRRTDELLRLSAMQRLDDLVEDARRFWPVDPADLEHYSAWTRDAEQLLMELPGHEAKLSELRAQALPWTEDERARESASHPKFQELERVRRHIDFHRRVAEAQASGGPFRDPTPEEAGLDLDRFPSKVSELNRIAWQLVDPERKDWGAEARGLLIARRAVEEAASLPPRERAYIRDTLAWALFACGRFEEAQAQELEAIAEAGAERKAEFESFWKNLTKRIEVELDPEGKERKKHLDELQGTLAQLEAEVSERQRWRFADWQLQWWHNQLEKLIADLKAFSDSKTGLASEGVSAEHGWGMAKRHEFARSVGERSVTGAVAAARWAEVLDSLRDPLHTGLKLTPQLGLLPLGRDPASGLWEFAHLLTGEPAERGVDGKLVLREETGLVFVLLPGGSFWMGGQRADPDGQNYDPGVSADEEPVHEVQLSPFFLSKYEMTQGQWLRFRGSNPSRDRAGHYETGWNARNEPWDLRHPVEQVSWIECMKTLERLGLTLPTEAQWEYATRGGTSSVWWTGDAKESLRGAVNLADAFAKAHGAQGWEDRLADWIDDGNTSHAPVGSYAANPFGLHDVCGNVAEWCLDGYDAELYRHSAKLDPLGDATFHASRSVRGGGFSSAASNVRSAARKEGTPMNGGSTLGLRPVRKIDP